MAGSELECWSAEHHTVWSNGDITFRITNFKTRAKFLEDAGRVRAVHLPFVSYYVENIRPHFAAVYELAKANQKKLTDETRRTRNGVSVHQQQSE